MRLCNSFSTSCIFASLSHLSENKIKKTRGQPIKQHVKNITHVHPIHPCPPLQVSYNVLSLNTSNKLLLVALIYNFILNDWHGIHFLIFNKLSLKTVSYVIQQSWNVSIHSHSWPGYLGSRSKNSIPSFQLQRCWRGGTLLYKISNSYETFGFLIMAKQILYDKKQYRCIIWETIFIMIPSVYVSLFYQGFGFYLRCYMSIWSCGRVG